MQWLSLSLALITGSLWACALGYGGVALMAGWLAVGSIWFTLRPGLFSRLLDEASR
jgi:hypothetical protein